MDRSDSFEAIQKASGSVQDILRLLELTQVHVSASHAFRLRLARAHALSLSDELEALLRTGIPLAGENSLPSLDPAPPALAGNACDLARRSEPEVHQ
jgi:hypothetical protein